MYIYHPYSPSPSQMLLQVFTISFVIFSIPPFVSSLSPLQIYLLSLSNTKLTFKTPVYQFSGLQSIIADGNFFFKLSQSCLAIKLHPHPPQYAISITILLLDPLKVVPSSFPMVPLLEVMIKLQNFYRNCQMWGKRILALMSTRKVLKVSAENTDSGFKFKSLTDGSEWKASSNLQSFLSAFVGCQFMTLKAIAQNGPVQVGKMKFYKVQSAYDLKKYKKGGKQNVLEEIVVEAEVETNGKDEELEGMQKLTKEHCPMYQMLVSSGVEIKSKWKNVYVEL